MNWVIDLGWCEIVLRIESEETNGNSVGLHGIWGSGVVSLFAGRSEKLRVVVVGGFEL